MQELVQQSLDRCHQWEPKATSKGHVMVKGVDLFVAQHVRGNITVLRVSAGETILCTMYHDPALKKFAPTDCYRIRNGGVDDVKYGVMSPEQEAACEVLWSAFPNITIRGDDTSARPDGVLGDGDVLFVGEGITVNGHTVVPVLVRR
jgi:hypothetical protein